MALTRGQRRQRACCCSFVNGAHPKPQVHGLTDDRDASPPKTLAAAAVAAARAMQGVGDERRAR